MSGRLIQGHRLLRCGTIEGVSGADIHEVLRRWIDRICKEFGSDAELSRRSQIPTSTLSNIRARDRRATLDIFSKALGATRLPLSTALRQLAAIAEELEQQGSRAADQDAERRPPRLKTTGRGGGTIH